MINHPKTDREAKATQYNKFAGNPQGNRYRPERCAYEVWNGPMGMTSSQCSRKKGFGIGGLYCRQHAKKLGYNSWSTKNGRHSNEQT